MRSTALFAALSLAAAPPAMAQEAPPPPPPVAEAPLPDVTLPADPAKRAKVLGDGYKFFYFHRPDTTLAEAEADLSECRAHLETGAIVALPGFIPFGETTRRDVVRGPGMYGLVGEAMAAIIVPKMERGMRNNKLRRCMGTRGYARYAVSEDVWNTLNEGDEARIVSMQARLASGPRPDAPEVVR